jgi:hypothetical protein
MGRAFEYRKARKLKRWGNMARTFTKLGKEITIAAKEGGPDPDTNPRLRVLVQQAKKENMPKENVERAIKKATDKDYTDYKEVVYEGYGPTASLSSSKLQPTIQREQWPISAAISTNMGLFGNFGEFGISFRP